MAAVALPSAHKEQRGEGQPLEVTQKGRRTESVRAPVLAAGLHEGGGPLPPPSPVKTKRMNSLSDYVREHMHDPRDAHGLRHRLPALVSIATLAMFRIDRKVETRRRLGQAQDRWRRAGSLFQLSWGRIFQEHVPLAAFELGMSWVLQLENPSVAQAIVVRFVDVARHVGMPE